MSEPLAPRRITISLRTHEEIVAALVMCDTIGKELNARVMVCGFAGDWDCLTVIELTNLEPEELADPEYFAEFEDHQLCITLCE